MRRGIGRVDFYPFIRHRPRGAKIGFMQNDTPPNQTCSESYTFLLLNDLNAIGVFFCIWGV